MRAAELVEPSRPNDGARLTNPELPGLSASNTLVANLQIVMPGRSPVPIAILLGAAPDHRGQGGYTVVNGDRVPCTRVDLVLTPIGRATTTRTTPMSR